jgi:hypothetical protein
LETLKRPQAVLAGLERAPLRNVDARFTGPEIKVESAPQNPTARGGEEFGALRLLVTLPPNKLGRPEPLLTTGRAGAGDFAYILYQDAGHVRFGLDHWGVGGALSEPVAVDYSSPLEIEIRQGALYPNENDSRWGNTPPALRHQRKSEIEIRMNGHSVLKASFTAYLSPPEEITVGENRIGGSNCDAAFTGEIFSVSRIPLDADAPP